MRILVISDIHGNLPALDAVLAVAGEFDTAWCLGDLVGYGPFPNECIEKVAALPNLTCIMGNHDAAVVDSRDIERFNEDASHVIYWTRREITPENLRFLSNLPETARTDFATLAHGSPRLPTWEYVIDQMTAWLNFGYFETQVALVGHSHLPISFEMDEVANNLTRSMLRDGDQVAIANRFIFNPGSVGQPRDHDPRAAFGILDTGAKTWEIHRAQYDFTITQEATAKAGLPDKLSRRLAEGW